MEGDESAPGGKTGKRSVIDNACLCPAHKPGNVVGRLETDSDAAGDAVG